MHCLPADISQVSCERGEVSQEVFERHRLSTYREASLKPFVIAAMILLGRVADPAKVMRELLEDRGSRLVFGERRQAISGGSGAEADKERIDGE